MIKRIQVHLKKINSNNHLTTLKLNINFNNKILNKKLFRIFKMKVF